MQINIKIKEVVLNGQDIRNVSDVASIRQVIVLAKLLPFPLIIVKTNTVDKKENTKKN